MLEIRVLRKRNWRVHLIKSWFCSGLYRYEDKMSSKNREFKEPVAGLACYAEHDLIPSVYRVCEVLYFLYHVCELLLSPLFRVRMYLRHSTRKI